MAKPPAAIGTCPVCGQGRRIIAGDNVSGSLYRVQATLRFDELRQVKIERWGGRGY
jgi:hypothetical protein